MQVSGNYQITNVGKPSVCFVLKNNIPAQLLLKKLFLTEVSSTEQFLFEVETETYSFDIERLTLLTRQCGIRHIFIQLNT